MVEVVQRDAGVTVPEGVQDTCRHGTLEPILMAMVVSGWWLDLPTLEVFSNQKNYDSIIP